MNIFSNLTRRYHFKEIDSTSNYLKRNYDRLKNMTFVSTDFQSAGRGRNTRTWVSDKSANLLFSFLIKDKDLVNKFNSLSILSAVCIKKAIESLGIKNATIKWPNDVYINGHKVTGILLDGITKGNHLDGVIIGIGTNVNQHEFPNDLIHTPTSISNELGHNININTFTKLVYKTIKQEFMNIDQSDYLNIARNSNYLKNKEVYAEINNEKKLVKVIDIDDDNSLIVEIDNKSVHLKSGEITFHL